MGFFGVGFPPPPPFSLLGLLEDDATCYFNLGDDLSLHPQQRRRNSRYYTVEPNKTTYLGAPTSHIAATERHSHTKIPELAPATIAITSGIGESSSEL